MHMHAGRSCKAPMLGVGAAPAMVLGNSDWRLRVWRLRRMRESGIWSLS